MNPITGNPTWLDLLIALGPIVSAIVWPIAIVIILLAFRKQVAGSLSNVVEASWGSGKLKFKEATSDTSAAVVAAVVDASAETEGSSSTTRVPLGEYFAEQIDANPLNVILESYITIEKRLDKALNDVGIPTHDNGRGGKHSVMYMAQMAVKADLLPSSALESLRGLSTMRNLAVHQRPSGVTSEEAADFANLADGVLYVLDTEFAKAEKRHRTKG